MATPRVCSIEGCGKPHKARGWCRQHYERWQDHGDPEGGSTAKGAALDWLRAHVSFDGDDCLPWPFATRSKGYGVIRIDGQAWAAHRWMCEQAHGPPPSPDHEAAHSCGKGHEGCVNPRHLRWATSAENKADMLVHGTRRRGQQHQSAKLTEADVRHIRALQGQRTLAEIGAQFGISTSAVSLIHLRRNWAWVQ
ncbi:HNH endonuclease [Phenylobacterium sp. VNQ135]|uniref:HNH endonuclease n=1 Tax=Phenylobacterium sp. VNQ135 TaxID=3400922 RepID=UPI003C00CE73